MNAERDFRLAQLAMRAGLVDANQLANAMERWDGDPSASFFETLADVADLGPDQRADLLDRAGEPNRAGDLGSTLLDPNATAQAGSEETRDVRKATAYSDLFGDAPATLAATIDLVPPEPGDAPTHISIDLGLDDRVTIDAAANPSKAASAAHVRLRSISSDDGSTERYSLTRLHAQGGLGLVWTARDVSLGREVALKELRPGRGELASVTSRFVEEAKITGRLEHPNIVPVYELARDPESHAPYYTMRFIKGRTLHDACRAYHKCREAGEADPVAFRGLLNALAGICHAIAYAHSKGVIHRDLKGQNVVLGDFGEVVVLDWGLARLVKSPDDPAAAETGRVEDLESHQTRDGDVLGTPAYMAPEQARGENSAVDQRSDVYGLGAILFEILTGRAPYVGGSARDVIQRVAEGHLTPPRQVNPAAPAALEAVCLKAMASSPAERYPDASDLAIEIERYLAGEPVEAYPEPWPTRLARLARRHRTAVAAAAVLLIAAIPTLIVGNFLIGRQRDRALAERALARQAVDEMYTDVAEQWLEDRSDPLQQKFLDRALAAYETQAADRPEGGEAIAANTPPTPAVNEPIDPLQRGFLERSLAYYERFADRPLGGRLDAGLEVAQARLRAAGIRRKLGQVAEADALYRRALGELDTLEMAHPASPDLARARSLAQARFASFLITRGEFDEADRLLERAEATLRTVAAAPDASPRDRLEWARTLREQAERHKLAGRTDAAEARFREAIAALEPLARGPDAGLEARHELAAARDALGVMLLLALDRQDEAAEMLAEAKIAGEALVSEAPTVPHLRANLGKTANTLGLILRSRAQPDEAAEALDASIASYRRLADDFPGRTEYRRALARALLNRGNLEQDAARLAEAAALYGQAAKILERLVAEAPEIAKHHRDLGYALNNQAAMLQRQGDLDAAIALYGRAAEGDEAMTVRFHAVPEYAESLAIVRRNLAVALASRAGEGDDARAVTLAELSEAAFERLVTDHPGHAAFRRGLAESRSGLGQVHLLAGRAEAAREPLRAAADAFREAVESHPETTADRRALVDTLSNLAETGVEDAEAIDREALAQAEILCAAAGASTSDRLTRAIVLNNLGEVVETAGRPDEADALFARAEASFAEPGLGDSEPQRLGLLAYVLDHRARLAESAGRLDDAVALVGRAVESQRVAVEREPALRPAMLAAQERLGDLLIRRGHHEDAARVALEIVKLAPDRPNARMAAARLLSRCIELAREDADAAEPDREAQARGYTSKGLAQLRVLLDSGYQGLDQIRADADLQALLSEDESRAVLPDVVGAVAGRSD